MTIRFIGCAGCVPVLTALWLALSGPSAQAALVSDGTAAGQQCVSNSINDVGFSVGACLSGNVHVAYVYGGLSESTLAPLVAGASCSAELIDNSANGTILGKCDDSMGRSQAVIWKTATPTVPPVQLMPLAGLLGIGGGVTSIPSALDEGGDVLGDSVDSNGT